MERWPAPRPYCSGVVLRHRAAAAACACITVDAAATAAYCTPRDADHIRPANGFYTTIAKIQGVLQKVFF